MPPTDPTAALRTALEAARGYPTEDVTPDYGVIGWSPDPIGHYVRWHDIEAILAASQADDPDTAPAAGTHLYDESCPLCASQADDPSGADNLGAAWAEAEAALPDGWELWGVKRRVGMGHGPHGAAEAWAGPPRSSRAAKHGYGPTPATALRALAAALRESPDGE